MMFIIFVDIVWALISDAFWHRFWLGILLAYMFILFGDRFLYGIFNELLSTFAQKWVRRIVDVTVSFRSKGVSKTHPRHNSDPS